MSLANTIAPSEASSDASSTAAAARTSEREEQRRAVANAWLSWQCKMVAGVLRGAVFSVSEQRLEKVLGHWPDSDKQVSELSIFANKSLELKEVLIEPAQKSGTSNDQLQDHIAIPVSNDDGDYVVVMHLMARSQTQQDAVVQLVQWGGMWLGSLERVISGVSGTASSVSIELAEQALAHKNLYAACLEAANRLAVDLQCQRVSVGLKSGAAIRLQAISQVADFDEKRALVLAIEAAMEEAVEQETMINTSDNRSDFVLTRAHEELQRAHTSMASCTIPLYCNNKAVGAVLLEQDTEIGFDLEAVGHAMKVLAPMGPVLQLIRQEQRSYLTRLRDSIKSKLNPDSLPSTNKGRIVAAVSALAVLGILFFPVPYNVSAQASIEGSDKQVLVAPQAGYIKSASASAGDKVIAGQLIASLEDRDLIIEKEKWLGELGKLDTSLARALSSRDRSELGLLQAKQAQVDAEIALIDQKLKRARLVAPFDGVLVSGDLSQSLGAPVEVGQVLFEVASMDSYRLILEIDEHDVAGVEAEQSGVLRFAALPGSRHTLTTKSIVPVALTRERKSIFSVEAELDEQDDMLRPGMRGIAKIHVGEKPLVWIWTHSLVAKIRLWLWKSGL